MSPVLDNDQPLVHHEWAGLMNRRYLPFPCSCDAWVSVPAAGLSALAFAIEDPEPEPPFPLQLCTRTDQGCGKEIVSRLRREVAVLEFVPGLLLGDRFYREA